MADPFQDVDAAGPEFIKSFEDSINVRQSDPTMEAIVASYFGHVEMTQIGQIVEFGEELADALITEHKRHAEAGTLYRYQAFATVIGQKGQNECARFEGF